MNDNNLNSQEDLNQPLNSRDENVKMEDIPAELFEPIGDQKVEDLHPVEDLNQPLNLEDPKETLEQEAQSARKYELGEREYNPKKKKIIGIVIGILIVLLCAFYFFYNSDKIIFSRGLSKGYKTFHQYIEDITSTIPFTLTEKNVITNEVGLSVQNTIDRSYNNKSIRTALDTLKDISVQIKTQVKRKDQKISGEFKITSGIYKAIDLAFLGKDNQVTFNLDGTINKPVALSLEGYSSLFNKDNNTSKKNKIVTKELQKELQKDLKAKKIVKKKATISIDDVKKKYKKLTYSFSGKEIEQLLTKVQKNPTIFDNVKGMLGINDQQWNQFIQKIIDPLKQSEEIKFSIYTRGIWNQAIGYELEVDQGKKTVIQIIDDKGFKKVLIEKNKKKYGYELVNKRGNIYWDSYWVKYSLKEVNGTQKVYSYDFYKQKNLLFNGTGTFSKTDEQRRQDGLITIDMSLEEEKKTVVTSQVQISYSTYTSDSFTNYDWKDIVSYKDLTSLEKDKIKNKFFNNTILLDVRDKISSISAMEVTDRNTTRYAYSTIDIINRLLKINKEKNPNFSLDGTYVMNKEGLIKDNKVVFFLDNETMLLYPDTDSIQNIVTIKNNQVTEAKLKYNQFYVIYAAINNQNPIFITEKPFK